MTPEKGFRQTPTPERGEKNDPRQEAADMLFDAIAPYRAMEEEGFSEEMRKREGVAMEALLAHEVSKLLGETYKVGKEEDDFFLARRSRVEFGEFDPNAELGIFANAQQDLPYGRVIIDFDLRAMSKYHDESNRRYFDAPLGEPVRMELRVSPEAVKRTYEKLEAEYANALAEYERAAATYETLSRWVSTLANRHLGPEAWDAQPLLQGLWPWAKGMECEIVLAPSSNGREEVQLVVYNGEKVHDIAVLQRPTKPERSFPLIKIGKG